MFIYYFSRKLYIQNLPIFFTNLNAYHKLPPLVCWTNSSVGQAYNPSGTPIQCREPRQRVAQTPWGISCMVGHPQRWHTLIGSSNWSFSRFVVAPISTRQYPTNTCAMLLFYTHFCRLAFWISKLGFASPVLCGCGCAPHCLFHFIFLPSFELLKFYFKKGFT